MNASTEKGGEAYAREFASDRLFAERRPSAPRREHPIHEERSAPANRDPERARCCLYSGSVKARVMPTRERLTAAGLELYNERGNFDITAAQIAERAGVTERTFFRYFPDKRDMLFAGDTAMEDLASAAIRAAAPASALQLAVVGLNAIVPVFEASPELVRERQRIIASIDDLKERELGKRQRLCQAIADALLKQGVDPATADLVAAMAGVIFHHAFTRWLQDPEKDLARSIAESAIAVTKAASSL